MPSTPQRLRLVFSLLQLSTDVLVVAGAFALAYWLRTHVPFPEALAEQVPLINYWPLFAILMSAIIAALFVKRQYVVQRAPSRIDQLVTVAVSATFGILFGIAVATLLLRDNTISNNFPRAMIFYAWILSIIFLIVARLINQWLRHRLRQRGIGQDRLLVVGNGDVARIILQRILWAPQLGYELVGIVAEGKGMRKFLGQTVLGEPDDLPDLIERHEIDEVIIAMPEKGHRATVDVIAKCTRGRVTIKVFPDMFQFITSEAGIADLGGLPLLSVRDFAARTYLLLFKRVMDMAVAGVGLVLLSPLMLLLAIAIKLESPGPVFFVQDRMGLDGRPFQMIKFRSMRSDAERSGPGWTVDDDPRRTRLGSILRRLDIDELPQLINVFLGEMSLVGPRPEQPYYVDQFRQSVPGYMERHREKAGMTGWAQINGLRGDTSIIERTKYDLWYSENWSLQLDIKILIRTVWQTVSGRSNGS
jgi:exopolysaccharide biosynthesis polyprenyl glycosylphosphotransferase